MLVRRPRAGRRAGRPPARGRLSRRRRGPVRGRSGDLRRGLGAAPPGRRLAAGCASARWRWPWPAGSLAVGRPSPVLDVVTSTAYLAVLATAHARAGRRPRARGPAAGRPPRRCRWSASWSATASRFGVVCSLLAGALGRRPAAGARARRPRVRAAHGADLRPHAGVGRRRAPGSPGRCCAPRPTSGRWSHRAADITLVLDAHGAGHLGVRRRPAAVAWPRATSRAGRCPTSSTRTTAPSCSARCDPRAVRGREPRRRSSGCAPATAAGAGSRPSGRRRGRPARRSGRARPPPATAWCCTCATSSGSAAPSSSSSGMAYTDYLTGLPNRARLMAALAAARTRAADGRAGLPAAAGPRRLQAGQRRRRPRGRRPAAGAGRRRGCAATVPRRRPGRPAGRRRVRRAGAGRPRGGDRPGRADRRRPARPCTDRARAGRRGPRTWSSTSPAASGSTELDPGDDAVGHDPAGRPGAARRQGGRQGRASGPGRGPRQRQRPARPGWPATCRAAIEQGQLRVVYQPVVGVAERRVLGLEALVRWDHPVLGHGPAGRVHLAGRGRRPDRAAAALGAPDRRRRAGRAAGRGPRPAAGRQRLRAARAGGLPGPRRRAARWRRPGCRRATWSSRSPSRCCSTPRTGWRATSPPCARWAASSRWTTSAAATPRWPTWPGCPSTS